MHLWIRFLKESKLSIFLVFGCLFVAQAQNNRKTAIASCEKKITQGVRGLVFNVSGNQMPAPGKGVQIKKAYKDNSEFFKLPVWTWQKKEVRIASFNQPEPNF